MSKGRAASVLFIAGILALMAWVAPSTLDKPVVLLPVEAFVEDQVVPVLEDGDPPLSLPDRALVRLGPIKDAHPDGELEFSPDGRLLIVEIKTGLQIWDLHKKKLVRTMRDVCRGRISPDGKSLVTMFVQGGGPEGPELSCQIITWHLATGKELRRYPVPSGWIHHLSFVGNYELMYVGNKGIHTLDLESGEHQLVCSTGYFHGPSPDFSPKTMTVAYAPYDHAAHGPVPCLFHCKSGRTDMLNVKMRNNPSVRLSPDGKIVATMGGSPLNLFNAETAKPLPAPKTSLVDKCVFSPDGKRIAWLGLRDNCVNLVDVASAKTLTGFVEPINRFTNIAFSPDGNVLASTLNDGSIVIWDVKAKPSDPAQMKKLLARIEAEHEARIRTRVTIATEKNQYFIGEAIYIDLISENVGKSSFVYSSGGNYRFVDRDLNYDIEAIHEDGEAMSDPNPNQMSFGGLSSSRTLKPGAKATERLELLAYRRLDRPGKYRISAGEGTVGATIELIAPTPAQARKLVADLEDANKPHKGPKGKPQVILDYRRLTHPVYLPLMTERARAGSYGALLALGQTPDPNATKALIELLDHPDPKFVNNVREALYLRMPDPVLDKKLHGRSIFDNEEVERRTYLRDKSWRPEFADAVRKHARQCLAKRDDASLFRGAFMLSCLGTVEDLPDFIAAFDFAVKNAQGKPLAKDWYPRPPGACGELRRAAQMFVERGVPIADKPKTSGERILFVEKINRNKEYRPEGWEATYIGILKDEMDYIREIALKCCPSPLPDAFKKVISERIRDSHVDVQIAALGLVEKNPVAEWKPAVLEVFSKAEEEWLRNAVGNAAYQLCGRLELIELYVGLIDDPKRAKNAVEELTFVLHDGVNESVATDVDTPAKRQKCKAAWLKFVAENREKLKKEDSFSRKDPIPIADLFPGIQFDGRD